MPEPSVSSIAIYQLRVVLCGVSPLVWRRLLVVSTTWKLDIRLERALSFNPNRALPSCIGGSRAAPAEDCAGALDYLERLDWHRSHLPIDELNIMG